MSADTTLYLDFSGRIIDHLGIQMYQSPIAAIAEMISNAWDADTENIKITLPLNIDLTSEIVIKDDGNGMTLEACQKRYLTTGYDTRGGNPEAKSPEKKRFLMGRKGIGKFAGFGIAKVINVETISRQTGEKTSFTLDIDKIRSDEYIGQRIALKNVIYEKPNEARKANHGTIITLKSLNLDKTPSQSVFLRGLSRRFILNQQVDNFSIEVNGTPLPDNEGLANAELVFPRDYKENEIYPTLTLLEDGWGEETLSDGNKIKWRIVFSSEVISEEDLKGISVFANKKIGQNPFLFNLSGSLPSNTGTEYIYGRVEADFIDRLGSDVISTERQRINWEHSATQPLLKWGQEKIKKLLELWKKRNNEEKESLMMDKLSPFGNRLSKLEKHERDIVLQALRKLATVSKIKIFEFQELGNAVLTAWEGGRLKGLIYKLASINKLEEGELLEILLEAKVLTALHTAESVRSKLNIISGFEERIKNRTLENPLRDFIAKNPWLISSKWETYSKEIRVTKFLEEAASEAKLNDIEDFKGRMDLVLSSANSQLLVLELMRPGLTIDDDHIGRFEKYIRILRTKLDANTVQSFSGNNVYGYLVADNLDQKAHVISKIKSLQKENMECIDWFSLLAQSRYQWKEFLEVLQERAPDDSRLHAIINPIISSSEEITTVEK